MTPSNIVIRTTAVCLAIIASSPLWAQDKGADALYPGAVLRSQPNKINKFEFSLKVETRNGEQVTGTVTFSNGESVSFSGTVIGNRVEFEHFSNPGGPMRYTGTVDSRGVEGRRSRTDGKGGPFTLVLDGLPTERPAESPKSSRSNRRTRPRPSAG